MSEPFKTYKEMSVGDYAQGSFVDDDGNTYIVYGYVRIVGGTKFIGNVSAGMIQGSKINYLTITKKAFTPKFEAGQRVVIKDYDEIYDGIKGTVEGYNDAYDRPTVTVKTVEVGRVNFFEENLDLVTWEPKFKVGDIIKFVNDNEYWNGRYGRVVKVPQDEGGYYEVSCYVYDNGDWPEKDLETAEHDFSQDVPYTDGEKWYTFDGAYMRLLGSSKHFGPEKLGRLKPAVA